MIILRTAPYDPRFPSTNQVGRPRPQGAHQPPAPGIWQCRVTCAVRRL